MKNFNETMYVVVDSYGIPEPSTLKYQRKDSIKYFLEGSGMTWKQCQEIGWTVEKVNVAIIKK